MRKIFKDLSENNPVRTKVKLVMSDQIEKKVLPFPKDGVTLGTFHQFIVECGGRENVRGLTTTEVCEKFLMPMTKEHGQQLQAIQQQISGSSSPWNAALAYRVPDSDINLALSYQQVYR